MIGRVILGVIAAGFFSSGFEEIRISPQASDTPIFSPAEVDKIDPSSTPYVQISGIPPVDGVCFYHYYENEPEGVKFDKKTYAPILAAPRAAPVSRWKPECCLGISRFGWMPPGSNTEGLADICAGACLSRAIAGTRCNFQ